MTTVYKLSGVYTGNTSLPMIGDYGLLDTTDMTTLIKAQTSDFTNTGDAGGALTYVGDATGSVAYTFADGVISCPDPYDESQYHKWTVPGEITSDEYTIAMLVRAETLLAASGRTMYLARHGGGNGVNLLYNPSATGLGVIFLNGATKSATLLPTWASDEWSIVIMSVRSDRIAGMHNSGIVRELLFADYGGAPSYTAAGASLSIGLDSAGSSFAGDIGGVLRFDRSMDDYEMASLAKAMKVFAAKKGINL
jgi:hypothetical protein